MADEAGISGAQRGVAAASDERRHVEWRTDVATPTTNRSPTLPGAAVLGDRRDADQARDLAAVEAAELGQLGEQGGDQHRSDTGHALQQSRCGRELVIGHDGLPDQLGDLPPLAAQTLERPLRPLTQGSGS